MTEPTNEDLARWIEAGLATPSTEESRDNYFHDDGQVCLVCAMSLAAIGKIGLREVEEALDDEVGPESSLEVLAEIVGIPFELADKIENLHCRDITAAEIAQMLRRGEI